MTSYVAPLPSPETQQEFKSISEQTAASQHPRPVTICQVLDWYRTEDGIVQASALRQLIGSMIEDGRPIHFENDSYFDALVLSEVMFDRSNQSIRLFTGEACVKFLQALQRSFLAAINRLAHSGGKVQILMVASEVPQMFSTLRTRYPSTFEVALAKIREGAEVGHFFVCDSKMGRIEEPHPPLTRNSPVNAIHATVYFNDPPAARMLDAKFAAYWKAAQAPAPQTELAATL
jgi:hypothetical protein